MQYFRNIGIFYGSNDFTKLQKQTYWQPNVLYCTYYVSNFLKWLTDTI
jgi:hypothetical protein